MWKLSDYGWFIVAIILCLIIGYICFTHPPMVSTEPSQLNPYAYAFWLHNK